MRAFLLLLLFCTSVAFAQSPQVDKHAGQASDELLTEGFEDSDWELNWTLVDADQSGSSWTRHFQEDYYGARGGTSTMGCRYNEDGSANDDWLITPALRPGTVNHFFQFYYRSQDPAYPESMEILHLESQSVLSQTELIASTGQFDRLESHSNIPIDWQLFRHELAPDSTRLHYFAIRCVSQDAFVLLVDDAGGNMLIEPARRWALDEASARQDFGLASTDSLYGSIHFRNLDLDSSLTVTLVSRPTGPFVLDMSVFGSGETLQFILQPDGARDLLTGAYPIDTLSAIGDTTWFDGVFEDSLVLNLQQGLAGDPERLSIPFTVAWWRPENSESLLFFQDFEADSLQDGWQSFADDCGTDTLGWELGGLVSSANFTIPARSQFAYVNSDGRGLVDDQGEALSQCAVLVSPWIDATEGGSWLLGWDQVYNGNAGGRLTVHREFADGSLELVHLAEDSQDWESRSVSLSATTQASFRLRWTFTGAWSYGAALDDVVLMASTLQLPTEAAPVAPAVLPAELAFQLSPNPFNPVTHLSFVTPAAGRASLSVYNLIGQRVIQMNQQELKPGEQNILLDFSPLASGLYLVLLEFEAVDGSHYRHLGKASYLR